MSCSPTYQRCWNGEPLTRAFGYDPARVNTNRLGANKQDSETTLSDSYLSQNGLSKNMASIEQRIRNPSVCEPSGETTPPHPEAHTTKKGRRTLLVNVSIVKSGLRSRKRKRSCKTFPGNIPHHWGHNNWNQTSCNPKESDRERGYDNY